MKYRALFLDMDGTFLDFSAAEREAFWKTLDKAGVEASEKRYACYSAINDGLWKAFERGEIKKEEIRRRRFTCLFERFSIAADGVGAEQDYERFLGESHALIDHAREVLACLFESYPLYAVTNGFAAVQHNRLRLSGIDAFLTGCFISEEIGCQKPRKEFFDACFLRLGQAVSPREVLLVGDSLTSDILGAKNAGIDACWFNPKRICNDSGITPDYEIHSLTELIGLLKERKEE